MTGYGCQLQGEGEQHQVSWLITHLNPAGTISLCDDDFAIGIIHLLATDLGADPERLYAALERFVRAEAARQARDAAKATTTAAEATADGINPAPADHTQADADQDEARAAQLEADEHNEQVTL